MSYYLQVRGLWEHSGAPWPTPTAPGRVLSASQQRPDSPASLAAAANATAFAATHPIPARSDLNAAGPTLLPGNPACVDFCTRLPSCLGHHCASPFLHPPAPHHSPPASPQPHTYPRSAVRHRDSERTCTGAGRAAELQEPGRPRSQGRAGAQPVFHWTNTKKPRCEQQLAMPPSWLVTVPAGEADAA